MPKKMVEIEVFETSGVDHPAHLHEGFAVMKNSGATPTTARAIFEALGKDRTMPNARTAPAAKSTTGDQLAKGEELLGKLKATKGVDAALQPIIDALAQVWQDLRAAAEKADEETPAPEGAGTVPAAPAVPVAAAAGDTNPEELLKSLPEGVRLMIEKAQAGAQAAEAKAAEALQKAAEERDTRLDAEAIQKSKDTFKHLPVNHAVTAPKLRKLAGIDPELHTIVTELLVSADTASSDLFKEVGTASRGVPTENSALGEVENLAKALVETGKYDTIQKARGQVYTDRPDLADRVRQEGR